MEKYTIAVFTAKTTDPLVFREPEVFSQLVICDLHDLLTIAESETPIHLLLIQQHTLDTALEKDFYQRVITAFSDKAPPIVLVVNQLSLEQKIEFLNSGCNDVICVDAPVDEVNTRLLSIIYHETANKQLKDKFDLANKAVFNAMEESSNLGNNIQFLLKSHQSANLDQLGQVFFQVMGQYGLSCSLQMRSKFGTKNMEANGMTRKLESELLTQLQDVGRFYEFDNRCIVNYGCVSLLVKNMPEEEVAYGIVKDNTFTLLQGLNARVNTLDEHLLLEEEKKALEKLSYGVKKVMGKIECSYQAVMLKIVSTVEKMSANIDDKIPSMMLHDEQEMFIVEAISGCVKESNRIFSEGLKVNEHFEGLITEMDDILTKTALLSDIQANINADRMRIDDASSDVELF